jgi:hypothetical protein
MNAKFEWLGLSVARKHVYFYSLLIVGTMFANTMKEQIMPTHSTELQSKASELRQLAEQVATSFDGSRY